MIFDINTYRILWAMVKEFFGFSITREERFVEGSDDFGKQYLVEKRDFHLQIPEDVITKLDLDVWARDEFNIRLDRRRTFDNMVVELKEKLKQKEDS